MLLAGIQANFGPVCVRRTGRLDPRLKHSGVTTWEKSSEVLLIPRSLLRGDSLLALLSADERAFLPDLKILKPKLRLAPCSLPEFRSMEQGAWSKELKFEIATESQDHPALFLKFV
jgi:hypothetical protein